MVLEEKENDIVHLLIFGARKLGTLTWCQHFNTY